MLMKSKEFGQEVPPRALLGPGNKRYSISLMAAVEWIEAYAQYRFQRRELLSLNERLLKDIGLSRTDAERIARIPFSGKAKR